MPEKRHLSSDGTSLRAFSGQPDAGGAVAQSAPQEDSSQLAGSDRAIDLYVIVSHTHWDREWHHTFQQFRARLVDNIEELLRIFAADPEYRFLLDGQAIMLEDFLEIRPDRRTEVRSAVERGQLIAGPWYVQADGLLPSGEAIVRNLLRGRCVARELGGCSQIGYVPDSFGHTARMPQILHGFGIDCFAFWRGIDDVTAKLPSDFCWEAADGSSVLAVNLFLGYSIAGNLDPDVERSAARLELLGHQLRARSASGSVLLMHGHDHTPPDARVREVAAALAAQTGAEVVRGGVEEYAARLLPELERLPTYRGELRGARFAPILAGVYSTRVYLKLLNAQAQRALVRSAEPWSALAWMCGAADERPALSGAWKALLRNQPHDSLPGCSIDPVHDEMLGRYTTAIQLANETAARAQDAIAGLPIVRTAEPDADGAYPIAVFNSGLRAAGGLVTLRIDPYPAFRVERSEAERARGDSLHPLLRMAARGTPLALIDESGAGVPLDHIPIDEARYQFAVAGPDEALRWVAMDVPPLGWRRYRLRAIDNERWTTNGEPWGQPVLDDGASIENEWLRVSVLPLGGLRLEDRRRGLVFEGLARFEDCGERGDTYLIEPTDDPPILFEGPQRVARRSYPSGTQTLEATYSLRLPMGLTESGHRTSEAVDVPLVLRLTLAPGQDRLDAFVRLDNRARDHRLRLRFPFGQPLRSALAGVAFGAQEQFAARPKGDSWVHNVPTTFPQHDYVALSSRECGLAIVAPGLHEAELDSDGVLHLTLVRAVGFLARQNIAGMKGIAGPPVRVPGAQVLRTIEASFALLPFGGDAELGGIAERAWEATPNLTARVAGLQPVIEPGVSLISLRQGNVLLSAIKPDEAGGGIVLRLLNEHAEAQEVELAVNFPFAGAALARLDEQPDETAAVQVDGQRIRLRVGPFALASILFHRQQRGEDPSR